MDFSTNRDYLNGSRQETVSRPGGAWTGMSEQAFMTRVLPYFGAGLLITALGGHLSLRLFAQIFSMPLLLGLSVLNLIMYFVLMWQRFTPGLNVTLYYLYTFINGLLLGPLLMAARISGGNILIVQALGITALAFFAITAWVRFTGKDFSGLRPFLVTGLMVVIGAMIVNMFVGGSGLYLGISILSAFLFMGFIAYDMSNIMLKYREEEFILATIQLYLDFLNLFIAVLRILISLSNRRD
ncbi:MAG TPA: Bax inhibitor-1 family protein [Candidatus Ozemobacteraceae bacterium]|nr:Bax inhibitor-1 family protein [Candidatus Ozemobacteraceae bacterium]